jgi:aminopeptidase N
VTLVAGAADTIHHQLQVELQPASHEIRVTDRIEGDFAAGPLQFVLHQDLAVVRVTLDDQPITVQQLETGTGSRPVTRYQLDLSNPPDTAPLVIHYQGKIHHALESQAADTRNVEETRGIIAPEGVYLDAASYWYPRFDDALLTFEMSVSVAKGWDAVSQGQASWQSGDAGTTVTWKADSPQDSIYLVAAAFTRYHRIESGLDLYAFLRTPDAALADRYLSVTRDYIAMFERLLGPYPYKKFALVENFWQSGYGMPSFTLLGSRVIRLPFILYSSYPHELLHNWWGNGVYVDYSQGNWSEGLTAYIADHTLQEQRGRGAEYRRAALQKYTDFVAPDEDFPLTQFRARFSEASEAVGYGKMLFVFHALRLQLGDEVFGEVLRTLNQRFMFKSAGIPDLVAVVEDVTGHDFSGFSQQWFRRSGAPALALDTPTIIRAAGGFVLEFTVRQTQPGPDYSLLLPVAITLDGREQAYQTTVLMASRTTSMRIPFAERPLRVDIDPEFDVFRRLDSAEIPPALGQLFSADDVLLVMPASASEARRQMYRQLAANWPRNAQQSVEIVTDDALSTLPADKAVWLLGRENVLRTRFAALLAHQDVEVMGRNSVTLGANVYDLASHSVVLTAKLEGGEGPQSVGWITVGNSAAVTSLLRKLPHYSKYSYLVFEGAGAENVDKGAWEVMQSPLSAMVDNLGTQNVTVPRAALAPRAPLVSLEQ